MYKCGNLKDKFDRNKKLKNRLTKVIENKFGNNFETTTTLERYEEFTVSNICFVNSNTIIILIFIHIYCYTVD